MRFSINLVAFVASFANIAMSAPLLSNSTLTTSTKVDSAFIFVCDKRNYEGTCNYIEVYDNICVNFAGFGPVASINQDDRSPKRCELYAEIQCKGLMLPCSGDCPSLFVLENNLGAIKCMW